MIEVIDQVGLFACSAAALFLLNMGKGFGSVIGLVGQVFWLDTAIRNGQWGLVALSVVYGVAYAVGSVRWLWSLKQARRGGSTPGL